MTKYSFKRKSIHISIENDTGEGTTEYELREMTAAQRDNYLDGLNKRLRIVNGTAAGVARFEGLQADLISACLYDNGGGVIPITEIQKWPASLVAQIFKQAQDMNQLSKEMEEAELKNG